MSLDGRNRSSALQKVQETKEYDLVVVGGGITGAGVARDAALRGLSVLLLEAKDYSIGTSSRSSKLVHGGLRYLENFEFSLVFEALRERALLLKTAPHMVRPLRFMMPIFKSSRVGRFKMVLGMWLYDILSLFQAPKLHENLGPIGTQKREPTLQNKELVGSFIYSDAYMEDDRLVIETLRSAEVAGAVSLNYTPVGKVEPKAEHCEVNFRDALSEHSYQVKAKHVVGCLGPWTDLFGQRALENWKSVLRPTKGTHLVFSAEQLPLQQAVVMAVETRIIFVIPRGEFVIVGTTDTDFVEQPEDVVASDQDVVYLLEALNEYFPEARLAKKDIVSCYSGVRPLVKDDSNNEGKTSREHELFDVDPLITSVAGGKYTTYRAMSEEIVDHVIKKSFKDKALNRCTTKTLVNPKISPEGLVEARGKVQEWSKETGFSEKVVSTAVERRGPEALDVLNRKLPKSPKWEGKDEQHYWCAEASFSIHHEGCVQLKDFYWRRSPLFLFRKDHGRSYMEAISELFAQELGWSAEKSEQQKKEVLATIEFETQSLRS